MTAKPQSEAAEAFRQLAAIYAAPRPPSTTTASRPRRLAARAGLFGRKGVDHGSSRATHHRRLARQRRHARAVRRAEEADPPRRDRRARPAALQPVSIDPAELRERVVADIRGTSPARPASPATTATARRRRSPPTSSATGRSSGSSPTTRSRRSWSTAPTRSGSSARAGSTRPPSASPTTRTCAGSSTRWSAQVGRRIDESSPMVDARLPDGSRVNAIIPPLSLRGPLLTIRKFSKKRLTLAGPDQHRHRSPRSPSTSCSRCVEAQLNILISGGTGTGKTTLLNALSAFDPRVGADRHDRGRRRAAAPPAARAPARGAPEEHRGRGRDRDPRPRPQLAAHAARPDHRRRGPRRRGARHAPGDEHRPRRLALDRPRQLGARRASTASRRWC